MLLRRLRLTGAVGGGGRFAIFNTEKEREPLRTTGSGLTAAEPVLERQRIQLV